MGQVGTVKDRAIDVVSQLGRAGALFGLAVVANKQGDRLARTELAAIFATPDRLVRTAPVTVGRGDAFRSFVKEGALVWEKGPVPIEIQKAASNARLGLVAAGGVATALNAYSAYTSYQQGRNVAAGVLALAAVGTAAATFASAKVPPVQTTTAAFGIAMGAMAGIAGHYMNALNPKP